MSDRKFNKFYADKPHRPESITYQVNGYEMHYMYQDMGKEATVVFIHGTPGAWSAFSSYFTYDTLYSAANIVAPDRPGFGKSSYGQPKRSLEEQAKLLKPMMEAIPEPRILVGHSLGGPIVARMAMDYPELVDGIIMLAPALDPELEPDEDWFRVPMRWPVIGFLAPKVFRISNEELIFLDEELELMQPKWSGIEVPTTVIQGGKDNLVDPGNAPFADSMLVNAQKRILFLENQNHFLPWNEVVLINSEILRMLREIKGN